MRPLLALFLLAAAASAQIPVPNRGPKSDGPSGATCSGNGDCVGKEVCGAEAEFQRRVCVNAAGAGEACTGDADCGSKYVCAASVCEKGRRGGLGGGAIAGIVVGGLLGLLLIAGVVLCCVRWGGKKRPGVGDLGPEVLEA